METILELGWALLIVGASLLPLWIAMARGVPTGPALLIGLLSIVCLLTRGLGYAAFAWEVLLGLNGAWAILVLWASVTASAGARQAAHVAHLPESVVRPPTNPGTSTATAT